MSIPPSRRVALTPTRRTSGVGSGRRTCRRGGRWRIWSEPRSSRASAGSGPYADQLDPPRRAPPVSLPRFLDVVIGLPGHEYSQQHGEREEDKRVEVQPPRTSARLQLQDLK